MNQLITYNNLNDGVASRRYTAFPLNSTLISSYTSDTIRSIINHAVTGKPYTTAVWIRVSRVGIQISAQDPQIARTRIPVFIPIAHVHDIFMQPSITNVICIVYEEVKSNMKGVLLYVVHPSDAHLVREDFRLVKQSTYSKGTENQIAVDTKAPEKNQLLSPTSQKSNDIYRSSKTRQHSPRRILYVRNNEANTNREITPTLAPPLPQHSYTPFNNSYHSGREDSGHRHHKSPRKTKGGHSSSKTGSDSGSKHRRKYRSRSPQKPAKPQVPAEEEEEENNNNNNNSPTTTQEQLNQQQLQQQILFQQQQQQIAAWQAAQQTPVIPMGIYNRYVPKVIPLPTGEKIKTTLSPSNTNGMMVAHIETQQVSNGSDYNHSPARSRSASPKRQDLQVRSRPLSAENAEASTILIQSSHHRHHHHRRHQINGNSHSTSKPDSKAYNTISHSSRLRSKFASPTNNNNNNNNEDDELETKQYLKRLIDDMQAMKLEMNKMRLASSSVGTTRGRSDSLRLNLKELRGDIDAIRARMAMTPRVFKK